jgi:nitrogen fixation NifU-like protein
MMDLRELYQEVILDHSRDPRNFGAPERANRSARGDNPLCGDRVAVHLRIEDGVVQDVGFEGRGCAISMASASLMTEAVKGKTEAEARELFARFRNMVTSDQPMDEGGYEDLDKLNVHGRVQGPCFD